MRREGRKGRSGGGSPKTRGRSHASSGPAAPKSPALRSWPLLSARASRPSRRPGPGRLLPTRPEALPNPSSRRSRPLAAPPHAPAPPPSARWSDDTAGCVANRRGSRGGGAGSDTPPRREPIRRARRRLRRGERPRGPAPSSSGPSAPPFPPGPSAPRRRWCRSPRWARPQPSRRPASAPHGSLLLSLTPSAMAAAAAEQQQFYLLLGNLLSPDNVVRKQAEVSESAAPRPRPLGAPILPLPGRPGGPGCPAGRAARVGPGRR